MDRYSARTRAAAGVLSVGAIVLSSFAVAQIKRLYLPIPLMFAIINLIVPIIALLAILISKRITKSHFTSILTALASASTFVPFIILVLSFVYGVPSDLLSCTSERQWLHLFREHDTAIRSIQDRLQCCGFNSLHDRAWPFPSHDVDARACERTLHYTVRCADVWLRRESSVASMLGFASFLNWIFLIFLVTSRRNTTWFAPMGVGPGQQRLLADTRPEERGNIGEVAFEDEPTR